MSKKIHKQRRCFVLEITNKQKERLDFWIKTSFYFIKYPEPCPEGLWIDREDKYVPIHSMSLDHLKASVKLIEREVNSFLKYTYRSDENMMVYEEFIIKPARVKKIELETAFREKSDF